EAMKMLPGVQSLIDCETRKNTIHRNTARRLKSRLAREAAELK
ncbi:MAG TPA: 30S ribosomal protein S20, partial [candidate division WOR-3 bacterium]|nr:30S ribosomal protein S20 [candidate division WOR-3 bacterium]